MIVSLPRTPLCTLLSYFVGRETARKTFAIFVLDCLYVLPDLAPILGGRGGQTGESTGGNQRLAMDSPARPTAEHNPHEQQGVLGVRLS